MGKLLSLAIIIALIYFFIVPKFRTKNEIKNKKSDDEAQNLVLCECCGAYVSEDEISKKDKKQICTSCVKKESV